MFYGAKTEWQQEAFKVWAVLAVVRWQFSLCTIFTILLTLWNSEQKNRLLINLLCFSSDFDETWWSCSTHGYYKFTKFHQNQMKNKKVLLIACFSAQNFKVSVESWKSYIVCQALGTYPYSHWKTPQFHISIKYIACSICHWPNANWWFAHSRKSITSFFFAEYNMTSENIKNISRLKIDRWWSFFEKKWNIDFKNLWQFKHWLTRWPFMMYIRLKMEK